MCNGCGLLSKSPIFFEETGGAEAPTEKFIEVKNLQKAYKTNRGTKLQTDKKNQGTKKKTKKRKAELRVIVALESIVQNALPVFALLYATARVFLSEKEVWHFLLLAEFL